MKILYGVQGTGNGHISRSRELVRYLKEDGHEVQVIVSGRDPSLLWDMEIFEPYTALRGLTFATHRGRIRHLRTARQLNLIRFYADIRAFDARGTELVITDYEPISARIARRHRLPSIGIGHQYAFCHDIPVNGQNPLARTILDHFAPADYPIGLHWHHFGQPILPPVVPQFSSRPEPVPNKILVYLPFEELADILRLLGPFEAHAFFIYHQLQQPEERSHLNLRPYSRAGFLNDLADCSGVITNAGFELVSEALALGKKILVKPLAGQMEQLSNAAALTELNLGLAMKQLDAAAVDRFLGRPDGVQVHYPNVARMMADWISKRDWGSAVELSRDAWAQTRSAGGFTSG
ncbi:MAG: hypothetical protein MUD16_11835 [Desulfobacterales bacterium]|jgi:uncharacterized protein (TIGR00661 family)|nr:hypothetical protein [Desulfobacterales bacterium]